MICRTVLERADQRQKSSHDGDQPPLKPAGRADANQLPHEQPEIEAGRVDQQPLANVRMSAEVQASHPTRLVEMREGPFQALAAEPQQPLTARTANATT